MKTIKSNPPHLSIPGPPCTPAGPARSGASIHDRRTVILAPNDYQQRLDPMVTTPAQVLTMVRPYPAEAMMAYTVGRMVNSVANEGPDFIKPVERVEIGGQMSIFDS